jgi:hypothetical protein
MYLTFPLSSLSRKNALSFFLPLEGEVRWGWPALPRHLFPGFCGVGLVLPPPPPCPTLNMPDSFRFVPRNESSTRSDPARLAPLLRTHILSCCSASNPPPSKGIKIMKRLLPDSFRFVSSKTNHHPTLNLPLFFPGLLRFRRFLLMLACQRRHTHLDHSQIMDAIISYQIPLTII